MLHFSFCNCLTKHSSLDSSFQTDRLLWKFQLFVGSFWAARSENFPPVVLSYCSGICRLEKRRDLRHTLLSSLLSFSEIQV